MTRVEILSPAKINYHLDVGGLRKDGFHEILSLFQAVSLYDRMEWSRTDRPGECRIEGAFPCPPEENLIYKAVKDFRSLTGFQGGVQVRVEKKIPHEAGLGGGSSNAAAALKAMALLSGIPLSFEQQLTAAASLGSDVPFFFYGAAAAVSGRGEMVEPLAGRTDFSLVLIKPAGQGISTGRAYAEADRWKATASGSSQPVFSKEDMKKSYQTLTPGEWPFFNTFFETFKNQYKPLEFISNLLYDSGAVFTGLSGSGSAVFGVFLSQAEAERAAGLLAGRFPFAERLFPLDSIPDAYGI